MIRLWILLHSSLYFLVFEHRQTVWFVIVYLPSLPLCYIIVCVDNDDINYVTILPAGPTGNMWKYRGVTGWYQSQH